MKKYLILLSFTILPNALYAIGGTIVIQNMSNYIELAHCRASDFSHYKAKAIQSTYGSDKTKSIVYYNMYRMKNSDYLHDKFIYDQFDYDKDDGRTSVLWRTPHYLDTRVCGFDHEQLCEGEYFYAEKDPIYHGAYGINHASLFSSSWVNSANPKYNPYVHVYEVFNKKGLESYDNDYVHENFLKKNVKMKPLGYDKFLGSIDMNGSFSQSYSAIWDNSGKEDIYSNVECDALDKKTGDMLGIVGGIINSYPVHGEDLPITIPFISGKKAKDRLSFLVVNQIDGPYNYLKFRIIDRINKIRGAVK